MIHRMDPAADPDARADARADRADARARGRLPPDEAQWAFEVKWDGVRAIAYSEPGRLRFESRNLNEITPRYPELRGAEPGARLAPAVLDGEIVALRRGGRPSFGALQPRMHVRGGARRGGSRRRRR